MPEIQARPKTAAERINELKSQLEAGPTQQRLDAAREIFEIGFSQPLESEERWNAASALFIALCSFVSSGQQAAASQFEEHITNLGYKIDITLEIRDDNSRGITTYHLTGPVVLPRAEEPPPAEPPHPARRRRPRRTEPSAAEEQPPQQTPVPQEEQPEEEPPQQQALGLPTPRELALQIVAESLNAVPTPAGERQAAERELLFPPSPAERAEEFVSILPRATSPAGQEAQRRISHDSLVASARTRMVGADPAHAIPIVPPTFEEHAEKYLMVLPVPVLGPILAGLIPLHNPAMYFTYENAVREARSQEIMRQITPPSLPETPQLADITSGTSVDVMDGFLLITVLDNPSSSLADRLAATCAIGQFAISEAVPLLASILHDPFEHGASEELVTAVRLALFDVASEEAIRELRSNPSDYALALSHRYAISRSERLENELAQCLADDLPLEIKIAAATALNLGNRQEGRDFLVAQFRNPDLDTDGRRKVAEEVKRTAWKTEEDLAALLGPAESASTRSMAAFALGGATGGAIDALMAALDDADMVVGVIAAKSLLELYLGANPETPQPEFARRMSIVSMLDGRVLRGDVVAAVALAMQGMLSREEVGMLKLALSHENASIRAAAAEGVPQCVFGGVLAPAPAVDMLSGMLNDSERIVADAAGRSLKEILDTGVGDAELNSRILALLRDVGR